MAPRTRGCAAGHRFDLARSGYLNLVQPQDRRSLAAGDRREAVLARRRLAAAGHLDWLTDGLAALVQRHAPSRPPRILDVGCGDGAILVALCARLGGALSGAVAHGLDLSVPAIEAAARSGSDATWVVGNADRTLPWLDGSFEVVLSVTARLNGPEMARVLVPDGVAIVAVPGGDDLVELREEVLGRGELRSDRLERALERLAPALVARARLTLRSVATLDAAALRDLLAGSYRGGRRSQQLRVESLDARRVTMSRDVAVLVPATRSAG